MNKFLIFGGGFSSGNLGVDAITLGTINAILDEFPNSEFICIDLISRLERKFTRNFYISNKKIIVHEFTTSRTAGIKSLFAALLGRKKDNALIDYFLSADAVIEVNGGDRFGETYGKKVLFASSIGMLIAFALKKSVAIFPQTIGPFYTIFGNKFAKYILGKTDLICVREKMSQKIVSELLGPEKSVHMLADMAFLMQKSDMGELKQEIIQKLKNKPIGINVSGYMHKRHENFGHNYLDMIVKIAKFFIDEYNQDVLLIPHVSEDIPVCGFILASVDSSRITTIEELLTAPQMKAVIGSCKFFVGSRMHSCIAALSTNTPLVAISYSHKYAGIMEQFELKQYAFDPREMNTQEILVAVSAAYKSRKILQDKISKKLPSVIADARNASHLLAQLIDSKQGK